MNRRSRLALGAALLVAGGVVAHEAPRRVPQHTSGAATETTRLELVRRGEAALTAGNPRDAEEWFERAGNMAHEADAELGQLRAILQAGEFRRALAFAAHIAGVHQESGAGAGMYAWLLHLSGQPRVAQDTLAAALARLPADAVLLATRELLNAAQPLPAGLLLEAPARFAPMPRSGAGLPARLRALASGVLVDQGSTVLTAAASLGDAERVWVRDGLGRTVSAVVTRRDAAAGLAELRLDSPLLTTGPVLAMAARDPFPGSPAFGVAYPLQRDTATPAWPLMRIGFVGAPSDLPGMHAPGIAQPAGGALFDNSGRLVAIVTLAENGAVRAVLPSRLRVPGAVVPPLATAAAGRLPLDELYERALARVVQVLSAR